MERLSTARQVAMGRFLDSVNLIDSAFKKALSNPLNTKYIEILGVFIYYIEKFLLDDLELIFNNCIKHCI